VCLLAAGLPAGAQFLSVGVRGGVPLNDAYSGTPAGDFSIPALSTDRFVIGPTVELHLPFGLGVQADALYRTYTVGGTVTQWEFPILASYHFHTAAPLIHPFVDAGPSFNHVSVSGLNTAPTRSAAGFAIGAGVEAKLLFIRIEPEIRYTHWGQTNFTFDNVSSNQNEVEFLVGVTF
jgi:opacity protein-like surface antigen